MLYHKEDPLLFFFVFSFKVVFYFLIGAIIPYLLKLLYDAFIVRGENIDLLEQKRFLKKIYSLSNFVSSSYELYLVIYSIQYESSTNASCHHRYEPTKAHF